MAVTEIDKGWDRIKKELKKAEKSFATAGIHSDAGEKLVDIAIWNHEGTYHIPPRPFLNLTIKAHKEKWGRSLEEGYDKILKGESSVFKELAKVGSIAREDIKLMIESNISPENAPATKLKKTGSKTGKTHTLIDKGNLIDSVDYKIKESN